MFLFEVIGMGMDVLQKRGELNILRFVVIELRMQFWVKKNKIQEKAEGMGSWGEIRQEGIEIFSQESSLSYGFIPIVSYTALKKWNISIEIIHTVFNECEKVNRDSIQ